MPVSRLKLPGIGNGNMLVLCKPRDIKTLYSNEERIPKLPGKFQHLLIIIYLHLSSFEGFANFEYTREVVQKDIYKTSGLISNKVK